MAFVPTLSQYMCQCVYTLLWLAARVVDAPSWSSPRRGRRPYAPLPGYCQAPTACPVTRCIYRLCLVTGPSHPPACLLLVAPTRPSPNCLAVKRTYCLPCSVLSYQALPSYPRHHTRLAISSAGSPSLTYQARILPTIFERSSCRVRCHSIIRGSRGSRACGKPPVGARAR